MTLFIDTHFNDVVIMLFEEGKIVSSNVIKGEVHTSKFIIPTIKNVCGSTIPDSIVVVNGPGSFTGVRLGVVVAKTLSYTWEIPIRVITSLEMMAVSIDNEEKIVSFNDNNGYYVGFFDKDNVVFKDYVYVNNEEYEKFKEKYDVVETVNLNYEKIMEFALKKEPINAHEVKPLYIKKLDFEND